MKNNPINTNMQRIDDLVEIGAICTKNIKTYTSYRNQYIFYSIITLLLAILLLSLGIPTSNKNEKTCDITLIEHKLSTNNEYAEARYLIKNITDESDIFTIEATIERNDGVVIAAGKHTFSLKSHESCEISIRLFPKNSSKIEILDNYSYIIKAKRI